MARSATLEELHALSAVLIDSLLHSAHGIILHNVKEGLGELLTKLGRPDLAALAVEPELISDAIRDTAARPAARPGRRK
jgi:hypothetical protein